MSGVELVILLLSVAPTLGQEVLSILQKGGHVSAQEWADYISKRWPDAESFFHPAAPVPPVTP
jgi:hypothetical protein